MSDLFECFILEANREKPWTRATLRKVAYAAYALDLILIVWTPSKQLVFALPPDTDSSATCDRIEAAMQQRIRDRSAWPDLFALSTVPVKRQVEKLRITLALLTECPENQWLAVLPTGLHEKTPLFPLCSRRDDVCGGIAPEGRVRSWSRRTDRAANAQESSR